MSFHISYYTHEACASLQPIHRAAMANRVGQISSIVEADDRSLEATVGIGVAMHAKQRPQSEEHCYRLAGCTPLMFAAMCGHVPAVERLLDLGARADAKDEEGQTVVEWACEFNHVAVLKALGRRGVALATPEALDTALHADSMECLRLLLQQEGLDINRCMPCGERMLVCASSKHRADMIKLLLEAGADPTLTDKDEDTVLNYAIWTDDDCSYVQSQRKKCVALLETAIHKKTMQDIHQAVLYETPERLTSLVAEDPGCLEARVVHRSQVVAQIPPSKEPSVCSVYGCTPLMLAIVKGRWEAMVRLLMLGADDTARNRNMDALLWAYAFDQARAVELLLQHRRSAPGSAPPTTLVLIMQAIKERAPDILAHLLAQKEAAGCPKPKMGANMFCTCTFYLFKKMGVSKFQSL